MLNVILIFNMKNKIIIITLCLVSFCYSEENIDPKNIPHYVWDSDSSNIGPAVIWFQDWTDYTRLFIKSTNGSELIEKHPYAKTDFETEYLNAKEITKPTFIQLLGNIEWTNEQNWSDNSINLFNWAVDRDQNWTYKDMDLSGTAKMVKGKLHLTIKNYDKVIIDIISGYRKYK